MANTADGVTIDVGDSVAWVERNDVWCSVDKVYTHADRVESGTVVSVGGNGMVAVSWVRFINGSHNLVSCFPADQLYSTVDRAKSEVRQ